MLGKVYTPFAEDNVYSLALDTTTDANKAENEQLLSELKKYFFVAECKLGEQPDRVLQKSISEGYSPVTDANKNGVLMVMMENYEGKNKSSYQRENLQSASSTQETV